MSILSVQCDELRKAARNIQGNLGRCLYRRKDVDEMQQVSGMLFKAADAIESLRDRLQDADVAYNDTEVLGDVTQGLFRDLMAVDPDTAKLWARSLPELFGEEVDE